MFNPFFIYCYAFVYVLILYGLKWSNLFPKMSYSVIAFFVSTIIIMFTFGVAINKKIMKKQCKLLETESKDTNFAISEEKHITKATKILILLHIINIIYAGNIPLLQLMRNTGYLYTGGFNGIPFIQTFLLAFSAFYATYSFDRFLCTKHIKNLMFMFLNTLPFILLFYRSTLVIIALNCAWIFLLRIKKIKMKTIIIVLVGFLVGGYAFGLAGDIRTSNQMGIYENKETLITNMGQASDEFMESNIPKQYFWLYMYSTSPLANFQHTVDVYDNINLSMKNIVSFVNNQILYDVFSLRINKFLDITLENRPLVSDAFNVSTIYGGCYIGIGWLGPILIFSFMFILSIMYVVLINKSKRFFRVGIATLNTIIFLGIFTNMFVATSLAVQLLIPFFVEGIRKNKNKEIVGGI